MKVYDLLREDGRIVKGVNTTPDVGVGQIPIEAGKFGNTVDKDGRPPTLSTKVKGKSTNVLFNLGLTESIDDKTKQNFKDFATYCIEILDIQSAPKIVMTNRDLPETFGFFQPDDRSITVSYNRRHQMDTMRTLAHELVHHKQRETKEELDGSDGSPDENEANAMAGVLLRRWAHKNPQLFRESEFTDYELALMEGGHSIEDLDKPTPSITELANKHNVSNSHILNQLEMGIQVEYEHTSNFEKAKEIALDHIAEDPNYYDHLKFVELDENFADGKVSGRSRPGRVARSGASCNGSVSELRRKASNASGERARMYHWCANMKAGRNK